MVMDQAMGVLTPETPSRYNLTNTAHADSLSTWVQTLENKSTNDAIVRKINTVYSALEGTDLC